MRKILLSLIASIVCIGAAFGIAPDITMTTTLVPGSTFTMYLGSIIDNVLAQIDFGDGILVNYNLKHTSIEIIHAVGNTQTIKIYGDSIIEIVCEHDSLTSLDITKDTTLINLFCDHNQLSSLNLSKNRALIGLSCNDNFLTSLDLKTNTKLKDLYCGYNFYIDSLDLNSNVLITTIICPYNNIHYLDVSKLSGLTDLYCNNNNLSELDLTNNLSLTLLHCYNNKLQTLDVTKNTALTELFCTVNLLDSLDVKNNTLINTLYCDYNRLSSIDLSSNTKLTDLNCAFNQLTTLDLTKDTSLVKLQCLYNNLTGLDLINNVKLQYIDCKYNVLNSLNVSNINALTEIYCNNNFLNFSTLPHKKTTMTNYSYAPQYMVQIVKDIDQHIDLSSHLVNGDTTIYSWKTKSGTTLIKGIDYKITNGVTSFLKIQNDSVFCEMTNDSFPDFTGSNILKTTNTKILGKVPYISMTSQKNTGSAFALTLRAKIDNTPVQVDFGDGTLVYDTINHSYTSIADSLVGSKTVKIYGTGIYYMDCSEQMLTSVDISKYTSLEVLYCYYNLLDTLNITKDTLLSYLDCYYNNLKTLNLINNHELLSLYCYGNKLTSLDLSKNTKLLYLFCEENLLTNLDVTKNTELEIFSCNYNLLSSIDLSMNSKLYEFYCTNNLLTFATLPVQQPDWATYYYAPQNEMNIPQNLTIGTELDLSSQLYVDTITTVYTWKTKSGLTLVTGTDYNIAVGKTVFLKAQTDSVYCEMTNAAFPNLSSVNVLKTTFSKVTGSDLIEESIMPVLKIYSQFKTLFINSPLKAEIAIYDINGRLIVSKTINTGTNNFQLQSTGIYLVKVTGNKGSITRKVYVE